MADFSLGQEMLTCRSKQNEIDNCEFIVTTGLKRMLGLRTFHETMKSMQLSQDPSLLVYITGYLTSCWPRENQDCHDTKKKRQLANV